MILLGFIRLSERYQSYYLIQKSARTLGTTISKNNNDRWNLLIGKLCYAESVCDRTAAADKKVLAASLTFKCIKCDAPRPVFATLKTLNQHKRKVHGERNAMVYFARADGVCPSCKTTFGSCVQLLGHLSDTRRPKCADYVTQHCERMSSNTVKELDVADRAARKAAYKIGRSHAVVKTPAKSAGGRVLGHPSAAAA